MIKRLCSTAAFIVLGTLFLSAQTNAAASAGDIMKEAYQKAAAEKKNVFVIFHASWCGWCRKLDVSMNDSSCKSFFDANYVIVHLVTDESKDKKHLENPGGLAMKNKYYGEGQGLPYWLVFDKDGNLLADSKIRTAKQGPEEGGNTGCPATEKEVEYFIKVLKKTSSITDDEKEAIRKRFRRNE
jgi:thiol-disulfide isomerase/thioredoxin